MAAIALYFFKKWVGKNTTPQLALVTLADIC
jgi:hypothetical protein